MKNKRKIITIALFAVLIMTAGVFAAINQSNTTVETVDMNEYLTQKEIFFGNAIKDTDKFKLAIEAIYASYPDDEEEAYMEAYSYAYALTKYSKSDAESEYLHDLIISGMDSKRVTAIYSFLQDTCYGIDFINTMYENSLSFEVDSLYWIDNAFDKATQEKHGILNVDDVKEYYESGLESGDIHMANQLCRKGIYTINEILDMRVAGMGWEDIFDKIYAGGKANHQETINVKNLKKIKDVNSQDIYRAIQLAILTDKKAEVFLVNENAEELLKMSEQYIQKEIDSKAGNLLESIGVKSPWITTEPNEQLVQLAAENGLSAENFRQLMKEGYSDLDIYNASVVIKSTDQDISDLLHSMNNGIALNEILNNGGTLK